MTAIPTIEAGGLFTSCHINGHRHDFHALAGAPVQHRCYVHAQRKIGDRGRLPLFLWRHHQCGNRRREFLAIAGRQVRADRRAAFRESPRPRADYQSHGRHRAFSDFGPYSDYNVNHTVYGNVTKVVGSHTLKFGAIYYHYNKHENQLTGSNNGSFSFDAQNAPTAATLFGGSPVCTGTAAAGGTCPFSFEQSYANFLLGQTSSFAQASLDVTANIYDNQFEYFGQDTWRVKKNVPSPTESGTRSSVSRRMRAALTAPAVSLILIRRCTIPRKLPASQPPGPWT